MSAAAGTLGLAAMLDQLAVEIAAGKFGDVTECAVFLRGSASHAIVTLPIETPTQTADQLRRAIAWLETGALPP